MGICPRCKEDNEFPGDGLCTWCYRIIYKAQDECFVRALKRRAKKRAAERGQGAQRRGKNIYGNSVAEKARESKMTVYDLIQVLAQYPADAVVMHSAIVSKQNKPVNLVFREAAYTRDSVFIGLMEEG